jgi:hypothetical protein
VAEHAHFLRDVKQADAIRNRLIQNIAAAGLPGGRAGGWRLADEGCGLRPG